MDAPTIKLQDMLQETLTRELHRLGEQRAAVWFQDTWTGEHGNYTNASAGYCRNRTSAGCEIRWRYMRYYAARHCRYMRYYEACGHARLWPMHG